MIAGVLPVVHTPMDADEKVDLESLERQVDWALAQGAAGCATGMVSELLRLSCRERMELNARLAQCTAGRGVAIAGVGAESTRVAVEMAQAAQRAGCDAVMALPPTSVRLPPERVAEYFERLADRVEVPLIVQDASSYVGQPIPVEVCVGLLDRFGPERILFKPEANPIGPHVSALRDATARQARILDGSGGIALVDSYRRGIVGTMPGMEFLPAVVALWNALEAGDEEAVYQLYLPLCALVSLELQAGLDGFLAVEKHLLARRGLLPTQVRRMPVAWQLDEETRLELDRLLERLDAALEQVARRGRPAGP